MGNSARRIAAALATATLVVTPALAACGTGNTQVEQPQDTQTEKHLTLSLSDVTIAYDHMDVAIEVTTDMDMAAIIEVTALDDEGEELTQNTTSVTARSDVHQTATTKLQMSPDIVRSLASIHIESPRAKNTIDDKQTIQEAKADLMSEDMRVRHILMRDMPPKTTTETKPAIVGTDLFIALKAHYESEFPEQIRLNTAPQRATDVSHGVEPTENSEGKGCLNIMDRMAKNYNRILVDMGTFDLNDDNQTDNVDRLNKILDEHKDVEFILLNNPQTPRLNEVVKEAAEKHENAYLVDWASVLAEDDARVDEQGLPTDRVTSDILMSLILDMLTPPKEERRPAQDDAATKSDATKDGQTSPDTPKADGTATDTKTGTENATDANATDSSSSASSNANATSAKPTDDKTDKPPTT